MVKEKKERIIGLRRGRGRGRYEGHRSEQRQRPSILDEVLKTFNLNVCNGLEADIRLIGQQRLLSRTDRPKADGPLMHLRPFASLPVLRRDCHTNPNAR